MVGDEPVGGAPAIPGLRGLHHVAIAVADIDAAVELWTSTLGCALELRRDLPDQGVAAASVELPDGSVLELVAPLVAGEGGVARFLEKRGAGLHHVAWAVDDVDAALAHLARAGARVIDEAGRPGLHGTPVGFVHPASTGGVLTELVEVH